MLGRRTRDPLPGPGAYSRDHNAWFEQARRTWFPLTEHTEVLVVEVEDIDADSWWQALQATLAPSYGGAFSRFVAHREPRARNARPAYVSAVFPRVWSRGTADALEALREQLEARGWQLDADDPDGLPLRFTRRVPDWDHPMLPQQRTPQP